MTAHADDIEGTRRSFGYALTGLTSWTVVLVTVVGVLVFPEAWLGVTLAFLGFFLLRAMVVLVYAIIGDRTCRAWEQTDWSEDDHVVHSGGLAPADVRHIVLVPNYKEPLDVLRRTLDALAAQHRAAERLIVVLGMEAREPDAAAKGRLLAEEYVGRFLETVVTVHPAGLPGEVPGKSSNQAWALQIVSATVTEKLALDPDVVTISSCDADSVIHPSYFAAVSRLFAEADDRHSRFWHAPMQYYNNIWRVPAPIRFTTWFGQAWLRANLTMPFYASLPISTYTLSLRLALDAGGWDPGVIPEDWHMYLRCFFARDERVGLTPVFLPTNGDAPEGDTWLAGMITAFQQSVRHAWGAEDVGYVVHKMSERRFTWRAALRFGQVYSDHVLRAAGWFLIMGAYLLGLGAHPGYEGLLRGVLLDLGPHAAVLGPLFGIGAVVMIATLVFEMSRQPLPAEVSRLRLVAENVLMWMLLPLHGLYLGMLPAMQAQTMLVLGLPLSYKVTPKRFEVPGAAPQLGACVACAESAQEPGITPLHP